MAKDARSFSPETQEALRLKAVTAMREGMKIGKVAKLFGVSTQAIRNWMKAFSSGGEAALAAKPQGRPKGHTRLEGCQAATISNMIRDRVPDQLKLAFALWTREAVQSLIRRKFGVVVSLSTVGRYLKRWGFTPQRPRRRAYEQDSAAVQQWLSDTYPAVCKRAKAEKALIYWGDEMGLRSDDQGGRSYAPKGKTPVISGTGQRFRCNVISAITNRGHISFMVIKRAFTAQVFVQFLRRLIRQSKRRVFLIVDGHPVHRSRRVAAFLAEHAGQIELFFLPGYCPELNPDEMLNQDVKSNALRRKRPRTQKQMMTNTRRYLDKRRANPELVARYFHEHSVRYAAA